MNAVKAPQGSGENGIKEIFGWTECEADGVAFKNTMARGERGAEYLVVRVTRLRISCPRRRRLF